MGYLFKDRTNRDSLKDAVNRVAAGRIVVDSMFSQEATEEYRARYARSSDFSEREIDVLNLLVRGLTNKEIGETLHLSIPVIERHLTKIFRVLLPDNAEVEPSGARRRENRRVLTVLEWLRRTGRLS
jgi:DNA-binding NarL/FixJ family response regulator